MEDEYEQRAADLRADLVRLRENLAAAEARTRDAERERTALAAALTEQNSRLTSELAAAARREADLSRRLEEARTAVTNRRASMRDHVEHLETLKEEVSALFLALSEDSMFGRVLRRTLVSRSLRVDPLGRHLSVLLRVTLWVR